MHRTLGLATLMIVISAYGSGQVTSFNTRTGAVTLNSSDVTSALGYTPADSDITVLPIPVSGTINAEFSAALSSSSCANDCEIIVSAGAVSVGAAITIPQGVRVFCRGTTMTPSAAMTEMFIISGGNSGIQGCQLDNQNSYATYGIEITKPRNNLPIDIDQNYIASFTEGVVATNEADVVHISRNTFLSTGISIEARGANINWTIGPSNYIIESDGVFMNNSGGGDEGFEIFDNDILPSTGAGSNSFCLALNGGLETTFEGNLCDQIVAGSGIELNGNNGTINATKIVNNWIGRNYQNANAMIGIYSYEANNTVIENNTIVGFTQAGIWASGTSSAHGKGLIVQGNNSYYVDPVTSDLYIDYQDDASIKDNYFNGTNDNIATTNGVVTGVVSGNTFSMATPIVGGLRYGPQNGSYQGPTYTVSQLNTDIPCTSALENVRGPEVTDATSPTFLATLVGSGAVKSPSVCIGGHWVSD